MLFIIVNPNFKKMFAVIKREIGLKNQMIESKLDTFFH